MSARLANAAPLPPLAAPEPQSPGGDVQLERICALLGIDGAMLLDSSGRLLARGGIPGPFHDVAAAVTGRAFGVHASVVADSLADDRVPAILRRHLRFLAAVPLPGPVGQPALVLVLWDRQPRSRAMAYQLLPLAIDVTSRAALSRQADQHGHVQALFDRASRTARIGVWACTLPDLKLTWTDSVYDLFELPRGSAIDRQTTVAMYTAESRTRMEALRSRAIAELGEFNLDAEIITARGNRRWMRLTGAVDSVNGVATRIFGMKQDITEEKLLADRTRYLAEFDVMTGLANRSQFQNRIADLDGRLGGKPIGGLMVVDLDGFKQVNDTFGHATGDECLKEAARRLVSCCAGAELVARIGGDEFAVLLGRDMAARDIEALARSTVAVMGQTATLGGTRLSMAASIGVAHRGPGSGEDLFRQADTALYAAKAAGRNTSRVYEA